MLAVVNYLTLPKKCAGYIELEHFSICQHLLSYIVLLVLMSKSEYTTRTHEDPPNHKTVKMGREEDSGGITPAACL